MEGDKEEEEEPAGWWGRMGWWKKGETKGRELAAFRAPFHQCINSSVPHPLHTHIISICCQQRLTAVVFQHVRNSFIFHVSYRKVLFQQDCFYCYFLATCINKHIFHFRDRSSAETPLPEHETIGVSRSQGMILKRLNLKDNGSPEFTVPTSRILRAARSSHN